MFILPKWKPELQELAAEQFDDWNKEKKILHEREIPKSLFINPREVWYVKQGINVWNEENGKKEFRRPVLVIRRIGNMYFWIPLTTKGKVDHKYYLDWIILRDKFEGSPNKLADLKYWSREA